MAEVTFRSVSKQYEGGGPKAVHDLELDIKDGEFMVLVGPLAAVSPPRCE